MRKHTVMALITMVAVALSAAACASQPAPPAATTPAAIPTSLAENPTALPATAVPTAPATAAPPTAAPTANTPTVAPTAAGQPATGAPVFTHPAEITNPLYPVSLTGRAIYLGQEAGKPSRNDVALLPGTKIITWQGQPIEARIAQFVAHTDGELVEVAYDYFAQADDGSVYYMGEDVSNYANGQVASHEGSWLAGKDGAPPALIMPAHPALHQVFNPENLPGVVFETDEVVNLAEKTNTPAGPTDKGMLVKETLMDGSVEHKVYAADYGIVEDRADDELLRLVLFNRADAKPGSVPDQLATVEAQAEDIIDVVPGGGWQQAAADVASATSAARAYRGRAGGDGAPQQFLDALATALDRLQKTSAAKDAAGTIQAANDLSAAVVDLYTVYRPALPADLGWLDVLERQVVLDAAANNVRRAASSLASAEAVWVRLKPVVVARNGSSVAAQFDASLNAQRDALRKNNALALTREAKNALELVDAQEKLF